MLNDERRGIEEAYQSAGSSSNLRVEAERKGDADVLIAAGWTKGSVGAAAIRLRGEWDRAEKPRLLAKEQALRLAATMAPVRDGETIADRIARHYTHEVRTLSMKLKSFRAVYLPLADEMGGDADRAKQVVMWWLDQHCQACGGTKWQVVQGSNRHSNKTCRPCRGAGLAPIPHGEAGKRAANYLDDCVQIARTSIKKRLRPEA